MAQASRIKRKLTPRRGQLPISRPGRRACRHPSAHHSLGASERCPSRHLPRNGQQVAFETSPDIVKTNRKITVPTKSNARKASARPFRKAVDRLSTAILLHLAAIPYRSCLARAGTTMETHCDGIAALGRHGSVGPASPRRLQKTSPRSIPQPLHTECLSVSLAGGAAAGGGLSALCTENKAPG